LADREEVEPPRDVLDRVRARLHENTVRSSSADPARATAPWTKRAWFAGAAAAAIVLIALLFCLQPSSIAWSQVAEAVRAMPWIHMKVVAGRGQSAETWISFSRNVAAMRAAQMVSYDDLRSGIRYQYDLPQKKLYRLSVNDGAAEEIASVIGLFQAIFRGDAIREGDLFRLRIVKQRQQTVTEQGRRWILYELELEPQGGGPKPPVEIPPISMVIRVNPEKMLPDSWTITQGKFEVTQPDSKTVTREAVKVEMAFDYPAEGPADIYALGAPRDAPVEDRLPPPDLDRIIKIVQQNRRDFGDYLAVAGGYNRDESHIVHLIRCKGDKFRVDEAIGDTKHVASGDEMGKWWRGRGKEILLAGAALCDGRRVYEHSYVRTEPWWKPLTDQVSQGDGRAAAAGVRVSAGISNAAEFFVDLLAYSPRLDPQQIAALPFWTTHFDPKGENGPAGSVRVEVQIAHRDRPDDRSTYHKEEFWLQPNYGYAVVKHVFSDCPAVEEDPLLKEKRIIHEYDGFRQTPRGLWYPTVSRLKMPSRSENKNKPDGVESHGQVTYFYLDFTAELPDELFSTDWHGDLLAGIHFAQRDEKPTASDLGEIRPPGGVPLFPSRSPITVQAGAAATKRLEAVPAEDLDKWVVELERITGKKLDGWLEKQLWRTEFVSRMSVAFDHLKWNAKAADILFKRAQTMPATEAKVWKEAFESLLKKKIGQTDAEVYDGGPAWAVPLVLIPVDALHEGQKYSVERAKKYLARLKQLTAEDVSLWKNKVDQFGGTVLDAAVNIILLDDYFDKEKFQREKFKAASDKVVGVYEAPHLVTSAKTADKFVGEVVALVGEAVNGKTPNVRVTSDFYVVCVGHFQFKEMPGRQVFDWPKDILGTQVKVIGRLKKSYLGETNSLPLIESNFGYFLQDGTYERLEPQQSAAPLPRDPRTGRSEGER